MIEKIDHFSNDFKDELEKYITEYKDLKIADRFFKIYETEEDFYFGDIKLDTIEDLLKPYEGKVISFPYPPDKKRYEIYLDNKSLEELGLEHKFLDGRCFIYGEILETFTFTKLTFIYHTARTSRVKDSLAKVETDEYLKLSTLKDDYYLEGDFLELTDTGILSSTDYAFSDYLIILKDNMFYPLRIEKINENMIEIQSIISAADRVYIYLYSVDAYYTDTIKEYEDNLLIKDKPHPIPIKDLALSKRDDLSNERIVETLINNDVGLYDKIKDDMGLEKVKTYKVKDLDVTEEPISRDFFVDSKREFKQPKFVIKIKNPSLEDVELFFNGKLYTDERILIKDPYYTYVYIGIEKLYPPLQHYINVNRTEHITEHLLKWLNNKDFLTVNLKRKDYIINSFVTLGKYNSFIFLNSDFFTLNGVNFYHNGIKMNEDEYNIVQLRTNLYIMIFHFKPDHAEIITMTGYLNEIKEDKKVIPLKRRLKEDNINANYEIYYQNHFIGYDYTKKISNNDRFIDVDTDNDHIRDRISDNTGLDLEHTFTIFDLDYTKENINGEKYMYPKFEIKVENPALSEPLLFYKDKLFTIDTDVIKKDRYTYIYIGVEKLDNRIQHFINVDKYKDELVDRYIDKSNEFRVILKDRNMIMEEYGVNEKYPNSIILKNTVGDIYNPEFYCNGEYLDPGDYEILTETTNLGYGDNREILIMKFINNVDVGDKIIMVGFLRDDENKPNDTLLSLSNPNPSPIYSSSDNEDLKDYLSYSYMNEFIDNDKWNGSLLTNIKSTGLRAAKFDGGLLKHFRYIDIDHNGYLELYYNGYDEKLDKNHFDTDYREQILDIENIDREIVEALPDYHKILFENPEDFNSLKEIEDRYELFGDDMLSYLYFKYYVNYGVFNDSILDGLENYTRPRMDGLLLKFMRGQDLNYSGDIIPANMHYLYPPVLTTSHRIQ